MGAARLTGRVDGSPRRRATPFAVLCRFDPSPAHVLTGPLLFDALYVGTGRARARRGAGGRGAHRRHVPRPAVAQRARASASPTPRCATSSRTRPSGRSAAPTVAPGCADPVVGFRFPDPLPASRSPAITSTSSPTTARPAATSSTYVLVEGGGSVGPTVPTSSTWIGVGAERRLALGQPGRASTRARSPRSKATTADRGGRAPEISTPPTRRPAPPTRGLHCRGRAWTAYLPPVLQSTEQHHRAARDVQRRGDRDRDHPARAADPRPADRARRALTRCSTSGRPTSRSSSRSSSSASCG